MGLYCQNPLRLCVLCYIYLLYASPPLILYKRFEIRSGPTPFYTLSGRVQPPVIKSGYEAYCAFVLFYWSCQLFIYGSSYYITTTIGNPDIWISNLNTVKNRRHYVAFIVQVCKEMGYSRGKIQLLKRTCPLFQGTSGTSSNNILNITETSSEYKQNTQPRKWF
jgi:hypothetical protein